MIPFRHEIQGPHCPVFDFGGSVVVYFTRISLVCFLFAIKFKSHFARLKFFVLLLFILLAFPLAGYLFATKILGHPLPFSIFVVLFLIILLVFPWNASFSLFNLAPPFAVELLMLL